MPPLGSCFAAWGDKSRGERWLGGLGAAHAYSPDQVDEIPDLVRQRGYAIALGHKPGEELESLTVRFHESRDMSS